MQDVPASYLAWLWRDGLRQFSGGGELEPQHVNEKRRLANYIWNSKAALELETGETLWQRGRDRAAAGTTNHNNRKRLCFQHHHRLRMRRRRLSRRVRRTGTFA